MDTIRKQFLTELKDLLLKYDASISFQPDDECMFNSVYMAFSTDRSPFGHSILYQTINDTELTPEAIDRYLKV